MKEVQGRRLLLGAVALDLLGLVAMVYFVLSGLSTAALVIVLVILFGSSTAITYRWRSRYGEPRCPVCRSKVSSEATICEQCQTSLAPN